MKKILALVITALISFTAIAADKPAAEKPIGKDITKPHDKPADNKAAPAKDNKAAPAPAAEAPAKK